MAEFAAGVDPEREWPVLEPPTRQPPLGVDALPGPTLAAALEELSHSNSRGIRSTGAVSAAEVSANTD